MKNRQTSPKWMLISILVLLLSLSACERPAPSDGPPAPTQAIGGGGDVVPLPGATNTPTPGAPDGTTGDGTTGDGTTGDGTTGDGTTGDGTTGDGTTGDGTTGDGTTGDGTTGDGTTGDGTGQPAPTNTPTPAPSGGTGSGGPTTHVVQAGETVYRLSLQYGVSVDAIAAANNLGPYYTIFVGQTLIIPGSDGSLPPQQPQPPGTGGCSATHVVQAGENLFRIGLRYGYTVNELAAANPDIVNPNNIKVGQVICIP